MTCGAPTRPEIDEKGDPCGHPFAMYGMSWQACSQGKIMRGRPVASWEDELMKTAGPNWIQITQSGEGWLSLKDAFTHRGVLAD
ncbi:unnamed protein product [Arctia plantaginis]|uniref:Uncharacterized protein n=1 Tax=Arctia plantaginis TaxID=874455 RepID=A0A8S0ZW09_ARCPL|nr:unnamed protein product [Arctia plantaginis]